MAQIKKLQKGNVFTIDGVAHNVDDKLIGRLYDHAKSLDVGDAAQFGKIIEALQNGENLSYDSVQNKLVGSVNWDLKNERQKRRVGKRNAISSGLVADTQNAVGALKSFSPKPAYIPDPDAASSKKKEKIKKNWSNGYAVKYITDEDGTKRLANTVENQYARNLLNKIHEINTYGDDVEFAGYGGNDKDYYKTWLSARTGASSTAELLKRLENGTLSDEDWAVLGEVGILNGTEKDPDEEQKKRFKAAGLDWKKHKNYFTIDDAGNISVTDALRAEIGTNGNIWFNEEWSTANPDLDVLKGRMLWNNRLYNESDALTEGSALNRALSVENGFFNLLRKGNRRGANDIMLFSKDLSAREKYNGNTHYNRWMQSMGPNFWYSSLVGSHTTDDLQDGQQLIKYYDGTRDAYGRLIGEKYAILDADGNLVADDVDPSKIKAIEGSEGPTGVSIQELLLDDKTYKGMYREDIGGGSDGTGFSVFTNPKTGETIIDFGTLAKGWSNLESGAVRLPEAFTKHLKTMSPEKRKHFFNTLNTNRTIRERFLQMLNSLYHYNGNRGRYSILGYTHMLHDSDLEELGLPTSVFDDYEKYMSDTSRFDRRRTNYVGDYGQNVEVHQYGGTIGKRAVGISADTPSARTDVAANAEEIEDFNLTSADKWQIASIAGNIGALIANMTGAGSMASAGIGLGSTAAQLVSDIKRDGFQWGDIGSLALNLGLDVVSLLPNAGTSMMAKLGRTVVKSAGLLRKILMGVGAVRGVQGLTNIVNGNGTLDDWKALSQGLLVGQRAIKSGRNIVATKYQPKATKSIPKTKEGVQKQYIEEFVAANKDTLPKTIKGISADGKVTNLSTAKSELKGVDGFSLPDRMASVEAAGNQVKGFFSSKWNPFSDQFVLKGENRVLSPETISAIKSGNSVWRSNAAHELAYLNPQVRAQVGAAGLRRPGDFNWKSDYIGNWFFRAPKWERFGKTTPPVTPPQVYQPGTQLALPAHTPAILYNGTYKAPYTVKAQGNLAGYRPTIQPKPGVVPAVVEPVQLALPAATTRLALPASATQAVLPASKPQLLLPEFTAHHYMPVTFRDSRGAIILPPPKGFQGREVIPVGHGTQLQIPFPKPYVTPTVGVRDIPMPTLTPTVLGKYWGNKKMNDIFNMQSIGLRPIIPDGSVQTTMFKKGGKVKKVRKCENGFPGLPKYAQGLPNMGIGFDNQGNVVTANSAMTGSVVIDPITGLPKEPTLTGIDKALQFSEALRTATPSAVQKGGNAIDLNELAMSQPHLYRNDAGEIVRRPKLKKDDVVTTGDEGTYGNGGFTQGVDKKTPYNWKPAAFAATELATSIGSAIVGGNKAKEAARKQALASKEFIPYENGRMYSDQHIGRAEASAYDAIDDQPRLVSNDPALQRAYELEKAKAKLNIAESANAQRSAGITAWNQEEAARAQRNRIAGAQNQQSAVRAELLGDAQADMIDATTNQSIANSLKGMVRELRTEDLYNTADTNTNIATQAQQYGQKLMLSQITNQFSKEMEADSEFQSKYKGDVMEWFSEKHPGEYADMLANINQEVTNYYKRNKINTGIIPSNKKGSKMRPTTDLLYMEEQKHVHKSIRDLNNNLVKMFLKMMS